MMNSTSGELHYSQRQGSAMTARHARSAHALARKLGWLSIGLGLAELLFPSRMGRATGLHGRESLLQAYGLREIVTGIGILTSSKPAPWVWARVAGDAVDIATLATRLGSDNHLRDRTFVSVATAIGVTALDISCAKALSEAEGRRQYCCEDYRQRSGLPEDVEAMRGGPAHLPPPHRSARPGGSASEPDNRRTHARRALPPGRLSPPQRPTRPA